MLTRKRCRAQNDRDIEHYKDVAFDKIALEAKEMRDYLKDKTDKEINAYRSNEFSRANEWVLSNIEYAQATADAKVNRYRKEEELKFDNELLIEKKRRKAIMRRAMDWQIAEKKQAKIAAMEAELAVAKAQKWAQMESEVEAARKKMLKKAANEAASWKEGVAAPVNEENSPPAVTGPGAPANAQEEDSEITLTDSEEGEEFEGDTTLVNDAASSPARREKAPRGRRSRVLDPVHRLSFT